MKDLTSIAKKQFLFLAACSSVAVVFLSLPAIDPTRQAIAEGLNLPGSLLWLPVLLILLGVQFLAFRKNLTSIAHPFKELAQNAERGEQGFAFKSKSSSREEDTLKHVIESSNLRAKEAREEADELESLLKKTEAKLQATQEAKSKLSEELEKAAAACRDVQAETEKLKASKVAVELTLENERKAKVGVEVEKRSDEIYRQMEKAVSAAAMKHIWIPSIVGELKSPISIINETASRLSSSWTQTSIAQVSDQLEVIRKQSETQLSLLNEILDRKIEEPETSLSQERQRPTDTEEPPVPNADPHDASTWDVPDKSNPSRPKFSLNLEKATEAKPTPEEEPAEPKRKSEKDASPYQLEILLQQLVQDFQPQCPLTAISFSLDPDLAIEIEDDALLALIHSLLENAVSTTRSGEILVGVELRRESLVFDVACIGTLAPQTSVDTFAQAEQHARNLNGHIAVETVSESELHFSFEYPFAESASDTSPILEVES